MHVTAVYLSEISQEKIRGILNSLCYVEVGLGVLYMCVKRYILLFL